MVTFAGWKTRTHRVQESATEKLSRLLGPCPPLHPALSLSLALPSRLPPDSRALRGLELALASCCADCLSALPDADGHRIMAARCVRVRRRAWCAIRIYELTPTLPRPLLLSMRRFALPAAKIHVLAPSSSLSRPCRLPHPSGGTTV